jgi:glycerophosphoryl diester phosphodiesterase
MDHGKRFRCEAAMQIYSHRGYHVEVPENTLDAFARAVAMRVDGIETDLRLSADNQVVLFHDRLVGQDQEVSDLTRAELSRIVGYDVPTLEEAVGRFADVTWMLEIKAPATLTQTLEVVRKYAGTRRFQITSFSHPTVVAARRELDVECGLLVSHRPIELLSEPLGWDPQRTGIGMIVWKYELLDAAILEQARALGLKSFVYSVYTPADHRHCIELGLDGVISDRPEFLQPA